MTWHRGEVNTTVIGTLEHVAFSSVHVQWIPSNLEPWNEDISINRTPFAAPNTMFVTLQPLKSGHVTNQDTSLICIPYITNQGTSLIRTLPSVPIARVSRLKYKSIVYCRLGDILTGYGLQSRYWNWNWTRMWILTPATLQPVNWLNFQFQNSFAAELESLLRVPIIPRSMFTAYPTRDENHKLLNDMIHERWVCWGSWWASLRDVTDYCHGLL